MTDTSPNDGDLFSPSSLNQLVRDLLGDALPTLWVEGEISNLARPASGHMYFALKDSQAQIRCALFRQHGRKLEFQPENGMQVQVRGRVGLYTARGEYQLIAERMQEAGEGALQREFERLKAKLDAEGLFAVERKRALPRWPRLIGVVSSPTGAAVRDVISVIQRRMPLAGVEVLPVPVQGKEAPAAIRDMLQRATRTGRHDVLVITRGGGSLEDLWAFNDEQLARLIAANPIPVLSAVGHEIDFTLADFVADARAATPSVAGELLVPDQHAIRRQLEQYRSRLQSLLERRLQTASQALDHAQIRLHNQRPENRLARGKERLRALRHRLRRALPLQALQQQVTALGHRVQPVGILHRIEQNNRHVRQWQHRLRQAETQRMQGAQNRAVSLRRALNAVSPLATMERGYALVLTTNGRPIRSASAVKTGDEFRVRLADGELHARKID